MHPMQEFVVRGICCAQLLPDIDDVLEDYAQNLGRYAKSYRRKSVDQARFEGYRSVISH